MPNIHLIILRLRKRKKKKGANHGLAKFVTREQIDKIWMEEIPRIVLDNVTLEQIALSV